MMHLDALTKRFELDRHEEIVALQDITLSVEEAEFACILGPSGCGKTTLLNIVAGFESPTAGTVEFNGAPISGPGPDRGVVFQEAALFPWLTAYENIEFGLRERGVPRSERDATARKYLRLVGLSGRERQLPVALSGGMRQRVALARVLANGANALLLDEPFAALDAQTRSIMHDLVLELWQDTRTTMLLVTHSIDEALLLGDSVIVMTAGPGRIKDVVNVDLPRPRDDTSEPFNVLKRELRASIKEELEASAFESVG